MGNSLHMLAISSEITINSNKSTQVNYNVKIKESSKMSKEMTAILFSHISNSVLIFNGKNVQLKEAKSGFISEIWRGFPNNCDFDAPCQRKIGKE